jgi:hypothetical protein
MYLERDEHGEIVMKDEKELEKAALKLAGGKPEETRQGDGALSETS